MKQIFLSLILVLVGTIAADASPRTRQQARNIAIHQAQILGLNDNVRLLKSANLPLLQMTKANAVGIDGETIVANDTLQSYYIFNNGNNEGWTIIGGDDRLPEIIGYSDQGEFTGKDIPDGVLNLLDNFNCFYKQLDTTEGDANAAEMKRVVQKASTIAVGPLLTCSWGQGNPYYYYCSSLVSTGVITGCIATAMAQVLYYLKNPATLTKAIPGYTTETLKIAVSGVSSARNYDWDNMLDNYSTQIWNQENRNAVAKLMYHCGIAVEMDYNTQGAGGSSAYNNKIASALNNYFGVNSCKETSSLALSSTMSTRVKNAIASSTPSIICGQRNNSGHCYVCDGCNASGQYHINWGWGGSYNGYFDLGTMNPGDGSGTYSFSLVVYDIDISAANKALRNLIESYKVYSSKTSISIAGTEVGMCANTSTTTAFEKALAQAKAAIDVNGTGYSTDQLNTLISNLETTFTNISKARVPYPDGQYYLECNLNTDQTKAMCDNNASAYWKTLSLTDSNFAWQLTYNSSTGGYKLQNVGTGRYIGTVSKLDKVPLSTTSNEIFLEPYSYDETKGFAEVIRPYSQTGTYVYLNQQGNTTGISISGDVVAWNSTSANSAWRLIPVEDADPVQKALNDEFKVLLASLQTLYDAQSQVHGDGLITSASQFSSLYTESKEGSFENLLDRDASTFWHSEWHNGSVLTGNHNFVVALNESINGPVQMEMMRRNNADNDHPTRFTIWAGNDPVNFSEEIAVIYTPFTSKDETVIQTFTIPTRYKYLKFICTDTYMADGSSSRGYFHMGDFQLYKLTDPYISQMSSLLNELSSVKSATKAQIMELKTFFSNYYGPGNVNADNHVTIIDVAKLISYLNGVDTTKDPYGLRDVNLDGNVDTSDVTRLVYILKTKK